MTTCDDVRADYQNGLVTTCDNVMVHYQPDSVITCDDVRGTPSDRFSLVTDS